MMESSNSMTLSKQMATYLKKTLVLANCLSLFVLTGCETSEDNTIAKAQHQLNKAQTANDGLVVYQSVAGITSPQAALIRCSAFFLMVGFTPASNKFVNAYKSMTDGTPGDPALKMMNLLSIEANTNPNPVTQAITGGTPAQDASYLSTECARSGSSGMAFLAAATQISTSIAIAARTLTSGVTVDNYQSLLADLVADPDSVANEATLTAIGSAASTAYDTYCSGANATSDSCKEISAAVTTGTDAKSIGQALADLLKE
ncbi:MAG: hypothetical protein COT74_06975 [Bdellovibrionales bacterium CG10_big_fil_rev_8_21_14_0_10_45_34]|nr:MAG: hypothetical protein COT74_06975 [Bdellovibrionales bacterium CG10_big_fil_rev_8_21_14_0_10_45_34]